MLPHSWEADKYELTTEQYFLSSAVSDHYFIFSSGLEKLNNSVFNVLVTCALCGGGKLQGLIALLFLPLAPLLCGYVSILHGGQMSLWPSVSSCCGN